MDANEIFDVECTIYNITKKEFDTVMLPFYSNNQDYVDGIWEQFQPRPISFCAMRSPIEPGIALMDYCIRKAKNAKEVEHIKCRFCPSIFGTIWDRDTHVEKNHAEESKHPYDKMPEDKLEACPLKDNTLGCCDGCPKQTVEKKCSFIVGTEPEDNEQKSLIEYLEIMHENKEQGFSYSFKVDPNDGTPLDVVKGKLLAFEHETFGVIGLPYSKELEQELIEQKIDYKICNDDGKNKDDED